MSFNSKLGTTSLMPLYARRQDDYYDDEEDEEDERELVRVPKAGRGRRQYEDEYETVKEEKGSRYYDDDDEGDYQEYDDDLDDYDEDYDDDDDLQEGDDEYASDILIPSPLLDSIDPEGAGERFGELARDPKFWFDVFICLAIVNFVEYIAHIPDF